jgi:hypothetical protein
MRKLLVALVVLLAVAAAPAVQAKRPPDRMTTDRGIVLRVRINMLQLRELDGSRQTFRVAGSTIVTLDGHPAVVLDLQPGDVAYVDHYGPQPAFRVRAFTR